MEIFFEWSHFFKSCQEKSFFFNVKFLSSSCFSEMGFGKILHSILEGTKEENFMRYIVYRNNKISLVLLCTIIFSLQNIFFPFSI